LINGAIAIAVPFYGPGSEVAGRRNNVEPQDSENKDMSIKIDGRLAGKVAIVSGGSIGVFGASVRLDQMAIDRIAKRLVEQAQFLSCLIGATGGEPGGIPSPLRKRPTAPRSGPTLTKGENTRASLAHVQNVRQTDY
jgi:hypothetical protein